VKERKLLEDQLLKAREELARIDTDTQKVSPLCLQKIAVFVVENIIRRRKARGTCQIGR
jgi:hypothetical protein